jgi:hypothetical protein
MSSFDYDGLALSGRQLEKITYCLDHLCNKPLTMPLVICYPSGVRAAGLLLPGDGQAWLQRGRWSCV